MLHDKSLKSPILFESYVSFLFVLFVMLVFIVLFLRRTETNENSPRECCFCTYDYELTEVLEAHLGSCQNNTPPWVFFTFFKL